MKTTIANLIARKRKSVGLTQRELSEDLGYKSPQFISNWERGLATPPLHIAKALCDILEIPEDKYKRMVITDFIEEVEESFK